MFKSIFAPKDAHKEVADTGLSDAALRALYLENFAADPVLYAQKVEEVKTMDMALLRQQLEDERQMFLEADAESDDQSDQANLVFPPVKD